jgi:hypothetical protein
VNIVSVRVSSSRCCGKCRTTPPLTRVTGTAAPPTSSLALLNAGGLENASRSPFQSRMSLLWSMLNAGYGLLNAIVEGSVSRS